MVRHTLLKFQEFEVHTMGILTHEYQGRGLEDVGAEAGGSFRRYRGDLVIAQECRDRTTVTES